VHRLHQNPQLEKRALQRLRPGDRCHVQQNVFVSQNYATLSLSAPSVFSSFSDGDGLLHYRPDGAVLLGQRREAINVSFRAIR
jgi:hypothetical protein